MFARFRDSALSEISVVSRFLDSLIFEISKISEILRLCSRFARFREFAHSKCDAWGFQPSSLTPINQSTALTWSNDGQPGPSPRKHHRPSLMTPLGQPMVKVWSNPLNTPLTSNVSRYFCRVLQISPKHFKFSQYKSYVFCRGTQFSCWVALLVWSANWWKMQVNACRHYSLEPRNFASWHPICAKMIEKKVVHPSRKW
jgi:hypothetical protein